MATLRTERLSDADVAAWGERLADGIARGMQLDPRMLDVVICTLLAGGHLLLEDRPGVGKTQLARSLAASIGSRAWRRRIAPMRPRALVSAKTVPAYVRTKRSVGGEGSSAGKSAGS